MQNVFLNLANFMQNNPWISYILLAWTLPWKGLALWKSARKKQVYWFVAFLLVNTVGLLEILYIFVFSKMEKKPDMAVTSKEMSGGKEEIAPDMGEESEVMEKSEKESEENNNSEK